MNKWVKAIVIAFVLSSLMIGAITYFSTTMARKVSAWQESGTQLSGPEQLAIDMASFIRKAWIPLSGSILSSTLVVCLIVASFKKS